MAPVYFYLNSIFDTYADKFIYRHTLAQPGCDGIKVDYIHTSDLNAFCFDDETYKELEDALNHGRNGYRQFLKCQGVHGAEGGPDLQCTVMSYEEFQDVVLPQPSDDHVILIVCVEGAITVKEITEMLKTRSDLRFLIFSEYPPMQKLKPSDEQARMWIKENISTHVVEILFDVQEEGM